MLLAGIGFVFRQTLEANLNDHIREVLDQEWAAIKGYLQIDPQNGRVWFYDKDDPDEALIVERLRSVYLLADANGVPVESSTIYRSIGVDHPEQIRAVVRSQKPEWRFRATRQGVPYLI